MGRDVSSPEEHVGLDLLVDEVAHQFEGDHGNVAPVLTVLTGLLRRIRGEPSRGSATQNLVANPGSTRGIFQVQVQVCELHHFQSRSGICVSCYLLVERIDVVVVLDDSRLVLKS